MKKILFLGLLSSFYSLHSFSQGCVPVRSTGSGITERPVTGKKSKPDRWVFSATNRYFEASRHYVGTEEQKQRKDQGTEVVNKSYTLDLNALKLLNNRWSVALNVPFISNTRSSLYEHGGTGRHTTEAAGFGDARLTAYRWLLNPKKSKTANLQAGLGVKLPTGNFNVQDAFYTGTNGDKVYGPVDQSIQLGDGGTGVVSELNGFYRINRAINLYTNLYYLVNPRETNGVSTSRGRTPSAASIAYGSNVMSVPDQYMARLGAFFTLGKLTLAAGMRIDGVPVEDLVGGSNGFRRPGYTLAAEPGVSYRAKRLTTFLNVPVAVQRNRLQSVPDKIRSEMTGSYYKGDAAFADYVINLGMALAINAKKKAAAPVRTFNRSYYSDTNNSKGKKCGAGKSCGKKVVVL